MNRQSTGGAYQYHISFDYKRCGAGERNLYLGSRVIVSRQRGETKSRMVRGAVGESFVKAGQL